MLPETQQLLQEASNEIKALRLQNQHMKARLDMFDDVMHILNAQVRQQGQGMSPDVCGAIEKHLQSIENNKTGDRVSEQTNHHE